MDEGKHLNYARTVPASRGWFATLVLQVVVLCSLGVAFAGLYVVALGFDGFADLRPSGFVMVVGFAILIAGAVAFVVLARRLSRSRTYGRRI